MSSFVRTYRAFLELLVRAPSGPFSQKAATRAGQGSGPSVRREIVSKTQLSSDARDYTSVTAITKLSVEAGGISDLA
jgi:hypothetical protein